MTATFGRMAVLSWVVGLAWAGETAAELAPDEVAVIAMAAGQESRAVAEYYVQARGIPESHVLLLPGQAGVSVSRAVWETQLRPAIRDWLVEQKLEGKIRCLVTCWDVPLKIGKQDPSSPEVQVRKDHLAYARQIHVNEYATAMRALGGLGSGEEPAAGPSYAPDTPLAELAKEFDAATAALKTRVEGVGSEDEKRQVVVNYEKILGAIGGASAVLSMVARLEGTAQPSPEAQQRVELVKGKVQGLQQGLMALSALPESVARDVQVLGLLRQAGGILGSIRWIDEQQALLEKNETHASFDSELSLLAWPDYPLSRWMQNTSHYAFDELPNKWPTLMVCRLAAPSVELVKQLIDTSIAVEKTGLNGKVYLDARGIPFKAEQAAQGSYGQYDQSLRDLAERLNRHTELEVVLDDKDALFEPGDCPEAALYCGWYSLGKYVDAFDWRPGAVGYHMASSEATSLWTPGGQVWCSAMLEDGIAATLGPVAEPYLVAFPLPDEFFSLLLTGRYTLVETFYRTKRLNSWQMVLVGDPLYNPFKNRPLLYEDDLPDGMKPKKP